MKYFIRSIIEDVSHPRSISFQLKEGMFLQKLFIFKSEQAGKFLGKVIHMFDLELPDLIHFVCNQKTFKIYYCLGAEQNCV